MNSVHRVGIAILGAALLGAPAIRAGEWAAAIPGDCDGDGTISIGEVQKAINMFLGTQAVSCGVDCDAGGSISIGEVQRVINGFLGFETSCPTTCTLACSASATPTSGTAPLAVSFTAALTATGCTGSPSFLWDFGDGATGSTQDPIHTYAQEGTYAWSVTVTQDGQTCTKNGTVTVFADVEGITVNLPGGVTMFLVKIPGGTFQMGRYPGERGSTNGEDPLHPVTIGYDFYIGRTEVTQAQWEAVMGSPMPTACGPYGSGDDYPVYCVSWDDIAGPSNADSFLKKLDAHLVATAQPGAGLFRLPSEAEWEYAARAGTATRFSHGDVLECGDACEACDLHSRFMWWCGGTPPGGAKRVASKAANPFGLYDMHGNLEEWVQDKYHSNYVGAPSDGSSWEVPSGPYRILRGGHWFTDAVHARSAARKGIISGDRGFIIGFRLARTM